MLNFESLSPIKRGIYAPARIPDRLYVQGNILAQYPQGAVFVEDNTFWDKGKFKISSFFQYACRVRTFQTDVKYTTRHKIRILLVMNWGVTTEICSPSYALTSTSPLPLQRSSIELRRVIWMSLENATVYKYGLLRRTSDMCTCIVLL